MNVRVINRVRIRFETLSQYKCFEVLLSALDALSTLTSLQGLCEAAVEWAPWRAVSRRDRAAVLSVAYATCFDLLSFPSPSLPQLETLGAAGKDYHAVFFRLFSALLQSVGPYPPPYA